MHYRPRDPEKNKRRGKRIQERRIHCPSGKIGWADRRRARSEMRRLSMSNRLDGDEHPLNTYWCELLDGHWHVGHEPRKPRRPDLNDPNLRFIEPA